MVFTSTSNASSLRMKKACKYVHGKRVERLHSCWLHCVETISNKIGISPEYVRVGDLQINILYHFDGELDNKLRYNLTRQPKPKKRSWTTP